MQAYQRASQGRAEIVMIAGPAGSGKTVLAQELQSVILPKQGLFLMGKFEALKRDMAYNAITQALRAWIKQVVACSEEEVLAWKSQLLRALENQAQLLIDIIPELEWIVGKQPSVPILNSEATKQRFHWLFQQLIVVLAQQEHPLILFLDDWQWADAASLSLLETLMINPDMRHMLLVGTYRDNEMDTTNPALIMLTALQKADVTVQTLSLSPLKLEAANKWIAETMCCLPETTRPLTTLIYQKTGGSPFFIKIFLQMLSEQGLLILAEDHWKWDLEKVRQLPATENVVSFMIQQTMQHLPSVTQLTLQYASCLGQHFSYSQLQQITQKPIEELRTELQPLIEKELMLQNEDDLQFAHDHIQEAAYQQISLEKRAAIHLAIGRQLQANLNYTDATLDQWMAVVNHLNQGGLLIEDKNEKVALAKLNFETSKKIKAAAAYQAALNYLHTAKNYLDTNSIWNSEYEFAFEFYQMLADVEYLNGNFELSETAIDLLLRHAHSNLEKIEAYSMLIIQKTMSAKYQEAIQLGYKALGLVGINLPSANYSEHFYEELNKIEKYLATHSIASLYDLPELQLPEQKAAIKLLYNLAAPTFLHNQELYRLITVFMVNLSLQFGNSPESAMAYSMYGIVLSSDLINNFEAAKEFGLVAIKLSDKFKAPANRCRTRYIYANFIQHWCETIKLGKQYIDKAYQAGIEAGEFQFVGYICQYRAIIALYEGKTLASIENELSELEQFASRTKNQLVVDIIQVVRITILNLTKNTLNILDFNVDNISEQTLQKNWLHNQSYYALASYYVLKAQVLYLYGYAELAYQFICSAGEYMQYIPGVITQSTYNFYYSLILIALFPDAKENMQQQYRQQLKANQINLKRWSDHCPANFLHRYKLVSAEIARLNNERLEAEDQYEQAIQAAEQQGFIQEQALTNELAAKFWLTLQKPNYARGLLHTAYQLYEQWGARYKVNQLSLKHRDLLKSFTASPLSKFSITGEEPISANSLRMLNLTSILKTSQAISSEVNLANLLAKIMKILVENAAAQKGAFLMRAPDTPDNADSWLIQAEYRMEGHIATLQQLPLSQWSEGAHSIIKYVSRTRQSVLMGDAYMDLRFNQDPYVNTNRLRSVLCLPVIRHQQLKSILYLENNLAPYMFTEQHLQILTILAIQIAISLENANLYNSIRTINDRFNFALDSACMGSWYWTVKDNKLHWDEHMFKLYGIRKEDFKNNFESFISMVVPEDHHIVERSIHRVLNEGALHDIQLRIIRQNDKSIRTLVSRGSAYRDDAGKIIGMIGACCDITPLKVAEDERIQALKQAEEKERRRAEEAEKYQKDLEDFVNMVCHEIRNPLAGIYGDVDLLNEILASLKTFSNKVPSDDQPIMNELLQKLEESTQAIAQCAKHQKNIIDDVLSLSKLESGKMEITVQPFRLKSIIEEAIQIFSAPLAKKKLALQLMLPESDIWVKGDANRLKMVLINFIINALKFTEQGYIKVSLQLLETTAMHTTFVLSVEDTGLGMTSEEISQLFHRFAQVASTKYEGSGLGLLISKKFIERMGGKIDVKSKKGEGSQFIVQLTCETATPPPEMIPKAQEIPAPISSISTQPAASKRILVVEDNECNQRIICTILKSGGYQYDVASNGREAIEKWAAPTSDFDLILMDIQMPIMGGFEATQAIRQQEQRLGLISRIPIIAMTAYEASGRFIEQTRAAGMDDFLGKPYERRKILAAIQKWTTGGFEPVRAQQQVSANANITSTVNIDQNLMITAPAEQQSIAPPEQTTTEAKKTTDLHVSSSFSFWGNSNNLENLPQSESETGLASFTSAKLDHK